MKRLLPRMKENDVLALKWLVKAVLLFLFLDHVIWDWPLFHEQIVGPYARFVTWGLEKILDLFGYEVTRDRVLLYVAELPYRVRISSRCTGLHGGFGIYLAVVLTLPASSLRARAAWLVLGFVTISAFNLARIAAVLALSTAGRETFQSYHDLSMDLNMLVGGLMALLAVRSLALAPRGIRVFRRSSGEGEASEPSNGSP